MRTASLLVLLLVAPLLWAQEPSSAPPPQPVPEAQPAPAPQPAPQAAPQPGHPLDPADVQTLTGRSSSAPSAPPYPYYYLPYGGGYGTNFPLFGGSQFSTRGFGPFRGGGNFFFFGPGGFRLPLFTPMVRHHGGRNTFLGFRPHH